MESHIVKGKQLIESIKDHIIEVLASNPVEEGISVEELQNSSGLTIKSIHDREVWFMGIVTILVELIKEEKIHSDAGLNTNEWEENTMIWLRS